MPFLSLVSVAAKSEQHQHQHRRTSNQPPAQQHPHQINQSIAILATLSQPVSHSIIIILILSDSLNHFQHSISSHTFDAPTLSRLSSFALPCPPPVRCIGVKASVEAQRISLLLCKKDRFTDIELTTTLDKSASLCPSRSRVELFLPTCLHRYY